MSLDDSVRILARRTVGRARFLEGITIVVTIFGLGFSLLLSVIGIIPQCPPLEPRCSSFDKEFNFTLIALGFSGTLTFVLLFAVLRAVSSRMELSGTMALRDLAASGAQTPAAQASSLSQQDRGAWLVCERCGSRNVSGASCRRCGGPTMKANNSDGWYPDPNDPALEGFFDAGTWTQDRRPATRLSLENWSGNGEVWLIDPDNVDQDRLWSGSAWTDQVRGAWGDEEREEPLK